MIERRPKIERNNKGLRLDTTILAELTEYQAWMNVPTAEIVEDAIREAISRNKEYQQDRKGSSNKKLAEPKQKASVVAA